MNLLKQKFILDWTLKPNILFPIRCHIPHWFFIDAKNQILGRFATQMSQLLLGNRFCNYDSSINQGNYIIIINASKINITGQKTLKKFYYRNSRRPGSLKKESFKELQKRIPIRILEKAITGMLPKGIIGKNIYKRLFIYSTNFTSQDIKIKKDFSKITFKNFWKVLN